MNLEKVPKPMLGRGNLYFKNLQLLDLRNNDLMEIDGNFCKNLPNLINLDLRNNKISTISEHIRAMMVL